MERTGLKTRIQATNPMAAPKRAPVVALARTKRTEEARQAARELDEYRHRTGYTSPCMLMPAMWDDGDEVESYQEVAERALVAQEHCWDCQALILCTKLRMTDPTLSGVVAGVLVDDNDRARRAREEMTIIKAARRAAQRKERAS